MLLPLSHPDGGSRPSKRTLRSEIQNSHPPRLPRRQNRRRPMVRTPLGSRNLQGVDSIPVDAFHYCRWSHDISFWGGALSGGSARQEFLESDSFRLDCYGCGVVDCGGHVWYPGVWWWIRWVILADMLG